MSSDNPARHQLGATASNARAFSQPPRSESESGSSQISADVPSENQFLEPDDQGMHQYDVREKSENDIDFTLPAFRFAPEEKTATALFVAKDNGFSEVVGLDVRLVINSGRFTACPFIAIEVDRKVEAGDTTKLDRAYGIRFVYRPGIEVDVHVQDEKDDALLENWDDESDDEPIINYEIEEFEIVSVPDLEEEQPEQFERLAAIGGSDQADDSDQMDDMVYVRLVINGGMFFDADWRDEDVRALDPKDAELQRNLKMKPTSRAFFMVLENPGDAVWLSRVTHWWGELFEHRWPPMPDIRVIGNHLYARYNVAEERRCEQDFWERGLVNYPRSDSGGFAAIGVRTLPRRVYWDSALHFECTYKLGITADYQSGIREADRLSALAHRILVLQLEAGETGEHAASHRDSSHVFVWLTKHEDGSRPIAPLIGTRMRMDPVSEDSTSSSVSDKWLGEVVENPLPEQLHPDLCLRMTRPENGRQLREHDVISAARADGMQEIMLETLHDPRIASAQLNAIAAATKARNGSMHAIAIPLLYTGEVFHAPAHDFRLGKDNNEMTRDLWVELINTIVRYRGLAENPVQSRVLRMFEAIQGPMTLLTGSAGTGKTRILADMLVAAVFGGYRVFVFAQTQAALENIASIFQEAWDLAVEHFMTNSNIASRLANKNFLRFGSSGSAEEKWQASRYPQQMSIEYLIQKMTGLDKEQDTAEYLQTQNELATGKATQDLRRKFALLRREQVERVLRHVDIIFMTAAGAGAKIIRLTTAPDFNFFDEASQMTMPAHLVCLQHKAQHSIISGDRAELPPQLGPKDCNPAYDVLTQNPLNYWATKRIPQFVCTINYRLPEEIGHPIGKVFYKDEMIFHPCTSNEASHARSAVRSLGALQYGLEAPKGLEFKGPMFFMVNVLGGIAMRESKGTSIANFAECEQILKDVKFLIRQGASLSDICVLTYYNGQVAAFELTKQLHGDHNMVEVVATTVDQAQGATRKIVLLGIVCNQNAELKRTLGLEYEERIVWLMSKFVRSTSRLCVALTRATEDYVVYYYTESLAKAQRILTKTGLEREINADDNSGVAL